MGLRMKEGTHERALFHGCESDARANLKPRRVQLGGAGGGASEGSRKPARDMAGAPPAPRAPQRPGPPEERGVEANAPQNGGGGGGRAGCPVWGGGPGEK